MNTLPKKDDIVKNLTMFYEMVWGLYPNPVMKLEREDLCAVSFEWLDVFMFYGICDNEEKTNQE